MSRTLNKVMLIGNVGSDPEFRITPNNIPVASFRLATSQIWRDKDGSVKEHTDWHTIVGWRGLAEVMNRLVTKGSKVYVEGRIRNRKYESSGSGKKQSYEIIAESVLLLEQRRPKTDKADDVLDDSAETIFMEGDDSVSTDFEEHITDETKSRNVDTFLF